MQCFETLNWKSCLRVNNKQYLRKHPHLMYIKLSKNNLYLKFQFWRRRRLLQGNMESAHVCAEKTEVVCTTLFMMLRIDAVSLS